MATCCAGLLVACGKAITKGDITGTYIADYALAVEKLVLDGDGTFIQHVTIKVTSKMTAANGKWSDDPATKDITFDGPFMTVLDGLNKFDPDYAVSRPIHYITSVTRGAGGMTIGVSEGDVVYRKP